MPNKRPPNAEATEFRAGEEQVEIARKGGTASGKARKRKADLRKMAQAILDGTFKDKNGREISGEEMIMQTMLKNLNDPKNWGKAMDLLVQLTGAAQTKEQADKIKADTALAKAKIAEIEAAKNEDIVMTDNFLEALNGTAAEDWSDDSED